MAVVVNPISEHIDVATVLLVWGLLERDLFSQRDPRLPEDYPDDWGPAEVVDGVRAVLRYVLGLPAE